MRRFLAEVGLANRAVRTLAVAFLLSTACASSDDGKQLPRCDANAPCDVPLASAGLRRLSAREYRTTVLDLVGVDTDPNTDSDRGRFDNGPRSVWITAELAQDYERLAWTVAAEASRHHRPQLVGDCTSNCFDAFAATFLNRAFRRSATATERERLRAVWIASGPEEQASLEAACAATLNSTSFLYREELGQRNDHGTLTLTDDELAASLSFFLTGSGPDEELLHAAAARTLSNVDGLESQARRLVASDKSKAHFEHFLDAWFATDDLAFRTKDSDAYPDFTPEYRDELHRDVLAFYKQILASGASARQLLTSEAHFGAETTRRYKEARVGILEHPAFLASLGGYEASGPIPRGVFALGSLLCAPPSPPPAGISRRPPDPNSAVTTRERYAAHVSQPLCQACHTAIDGVGFGFEGFDGAGRVRTQERGRPIDDSGVILLPNRSAVAFRGTRDFAEQALKLPELAMCYYVQLTRFSLGGGERGADTKHAYALGGATTADEPMAEILLRFVRTRAFRERKVTP